LALTAAASAFPAAGLAFVGAAGAFAIGVPAEAVFAHIASPNGFWGLQ
jgi:hypothetical protein